MRNTRELLNLLLNSVINCSQTFFTGMCGEIFEMYVNDEISREEFVVLENYLEGNETEEFNISGYWWKRGLKQPRIEWLDEQIKKLS